MSKPMNFIFFNPDELRAESIGCYGHQLVRTPNIDQLAGEGTRFHNCFCQAPLCGPSRCSLATGWYPHVRGHRTNTYLVRPGEPNMFRYLKKAGYHVYWDGGHNDLLAEESFADSVSELKNSGAFHWNFNHYENDDPRKFSFLYEPYDMPLAQHGDYAKVQAAIDFLKRDHDKPFAVWLPLLYPHAPYSAPQPWHDMYNPDEIPALRDINSCENKPEYYTRIRESRRLGQLDEAFFRKINAVYLGMTSFIDKILGDLLQALNETGLAENTAIVFFSDHGDWAGDYGLVEKWSNAMDDILLRVPLIIKAPGCKQGHVVNEQTEVLDILATVLDLAGIESGHDHFSQSLVPQLKGAAGDPDRPVYAEGGYDAHEIREKSKEELNGARGPWQHYYPKALVEFEHPSTIARTSMIRTPRYKYVRRTSGEHELYDVQADPLEYKNLAGNAEYAAVGNEMAGRLLDWFVRTSDVIDSAVDERGIPQE
ncbi:MAG: sulfatase-like hydrolase/transferase [Chitinivibrionales bacterium]|nr:sulfatase-like hydrolase/transferase [Chitinivibrionales bacterium]